MRNYQILILFLLLSSFSASAQPLTGIKTIPGDYPTIAAAISSLNANGAGPGGVTFNVAADLKETFSTATAGVITTNTGSATSPIVFQKSGTGAKPLITAGPGAGSMDAIFMITGCDYVTFDGFEIQEDPKNGEPVSQMEWGFAILKSSGTNGSQHVTIRNCIIRLDYTNASSTGIYSNNHTSSSMTQLIVSSSGGTNSSLKLYNNTIENTYHGIYLKGYADSASPYAFYDQDNEIGKDGANMIPHFGGGSEIAYGIYTSAQNNLKVANNNVTSTMGGEKTVYGIQMTASLNAFYELYGNTVSIQYETWEPYNAHFYGINCDMGASGTSNTANVYNNTVTNCTFSGSESGTFYTFYLNNLGVNANVYGNTVSNNTYGSTSVNATGTVRYFWVNKATTTSGPLTVHDNLVSGNARYQFQPSTSTTMMLAVAGSGTTGEIYNNTVQNIVVTSTGAAYGLYMIYTDQNGKNVYNNTISNITEANGSVYGLYNANGTTGNIHRNRISGIHASPYVSSAFIVGLNHTSGTSMYYYNNMISELTNQGSTSTLGYDYITLVGINVESFGNVKGFYNNTVFLNAPTQSNEFGSSAFMSASLSGIDLRNNIFVNTSAFAGANGKTVVLHSRNTSFSGYTSNYNDLYAGTPGPSNLIFSNPAVGDQTLAQYQARVSPNDAQSVTSMPAFMNITSSPYNLHLSAAIPGQCESGGVIVGNPVPIQVDFDGEPRYPNAGYPENPLYPATAPDLGADEYAGRPLDVVAPNIVYTPLTDINHGNARTLEAVITDGSGVPVSGFGLPVLYWRKNGSLYLQTQGISLGNNIYAFTFGAGSVLGDLIEYYIVAQDLVTPVPNVGAYPMQGVGGFSSNPPACATPPANPSGYRVISDISGIKHIGIGKDYTTLTSAAADLNLKYMAGPVTFILDDSNYPTETFPVKFNARPGNSAINTLTIKPDVNANVTISGSSAGSGILIFNGLDYVTLDGSNNGTDTKNLILENTSYSGNAHVVSLSNNNGTDPSTYVTMKNTTMRGAKSWNPYIDTYVIVFNYLGGASGGGYNNCLISNNFIQRAKIGISLLGSLGNVNRNNTISGNIIGSPDTNFHIQRYGIGLSSCDNTLIADNEIMGTSVPTIFDGLYGIIYYDYTSNTKIHRNKIHDWNTYSLGSFGIRCSSFLDNTPTEIFDNLIYNISTPGMNQGPANNNAYGIFVRQGGNIKIWNNTINLDGPYLAGSDSYAPSSACLGFYDQSTNNFDIRGNIFRNAMTNPNNPPPGSGAEGRAYGIMFTGPVSKFSYLDNNNYYIDGYRGTIALHWQPGVGPITTLDTLESWQAYTGQEANSTDLNPQFVSEVPPQNYHPTNYNLNNLGGPKLNDYDLVMAPRYNPMDMGCYEWTTTITNYHTLAATDVTTTTTTLNGDINTNGEWANVIFDYGLTDTYGSVATPAPATVRSVGTLLPVSAAISGLQPGTTYHYRFRALSTTSAQGWVYGSDMTFTTVPSIPENTTVTGSETGTNCYNASNTITVAGGGSTYNLAPGGNATFIAGQKISFLPGTTIQAGAYMLAYITSTNQYCNSMDNPLVSASGSNEKDAEQPTFAPEVDNTINLYPNPVTSSTTLEISGSGFESATRATIFTMSGAPVLSQTLEGCGKYTLSLTNMKAGIYLLRITGEQSTATLRIVKM